MKELNYPFDSGEIILKKKRLRRELLASGADFVDKKIAILGGYTTTDIKLILELFLLNYGIRPEFYECEYNRFYEEAMFDNAGLFAFAPDIIYVCTSNRNIRSYPEIGMSEQDVNALLEAERDKYYGIWDSLAERYRCPVIQNNFEMPLYRLLGNMDASDIHGRVNFLSRLNEEFYSYARSHEHFYICDINYISADYGLREWSDPFYYHMYKYALNVNAIPYLSFNVANIIKSIFGKNKKGLVLDLDNTLWGGVIGDDGVDNIAIGPEESEGQVYSEFQRYIKAQTSLGVILAIDSKNDEENALLGLSHRYSELQKDDFVSIKANWDPKDKNFLDIGNEVNLLPESLVFIDDNPAERHIVESQIPGVIAPEIGEVHQYIVNIDRGGYFETTTLSEDDAKRNEMYRENAKRSSAMASFADYGEYLASLEMKAEIKAFSPEHMPRIAQLTNKSNQFNLTTRRYTQTELEEIASDPGYITLYGRLEDRFGDNGLVSAVIGHIEDNICHIRLWIMSCRVLKRDMEFAMMDELVRICKERGIAEIRGYYYPTAKNGMVRDFYQVQGFEQMNDVSGTEPGDTVWSLKLSDSPVCRNKYITVDRGGSL